MENIPSEPKVIAGVGEMNFGKQFRQGNRIYSTDAVSPALQANTGNASGGSVLIGEPRVKQIGSLNTSKRKNPQRCRVYDAEGVSPTLGACMGEGGNTQPMIRAVLTPDREEKRQNGRRMKEAGESMFTLTAQDRHGVAIGGCYTNGNQAYDRPIMKGAARAVVAQGGNGVLVTEDERLDNCGQ